MPSVDHLSHDFKMTDHLDHDHHFNIHPHWSGHRRTIAGWMSTPAFKNGVPAIIVVSVILCVVEVDMRAQEITIPTWMTIIECMLQLCFVTELSMRIHVLRTKFFQVTANVMDLIIVTVDFILSIVCIAVEAEKAPYSSVFRLFRILRTARLNRVLSDFRELYLIVHGFASALKTIIWGSVMLAVVLVVWSILAVEVLNPLAKELGKQGAYPNCERCPRAFASIAQSSLTFFQTILAGDAWGVLCVPIIEHHPWTSMIFYGVLATI
jgi:hypothetical protein